MSKPFSTYSENISKKQIFHFFLFCYIFGFWAKVLKEIAWNFPQSCQNSFVRVQTKTLMKKEDFWKLFFWSKLEQIFSWLLAKNILKNWQNCFVSVQTNTLMYSQHLLWKVLPLFLDFGRNFFWIFEFFFFAKVWKLFSKNWNEHFNQKILFWKILKFFRNRIQTFSDFRPKVYGKIVRTVIYVFKNMLKEQNFSFSFSSCRFVGFWAKLFWQLAQNFPQSCQNCFLRNQTHTLMKRDDFGNLFFFRSSSKFIPDFWEKLIFKVGRTAF